MKPGVSILLFASLALALSAGPGQAAKPKAPVPAEADGLRGPLGEAKPKPLQSPVPLLATGFASPAVDSDSCHMACARSYYFCLAAETPEQCPGHWIQCRSSCPQSPGPTAARP